MVGFGNQRLEIGNSGASPGKKGLLTKQSVSHSHSLLFIQVNGGRKRVKNTL
jgi:hypothetical protein